MRRPTPLSETYAVTNSGCWLPRQDRVTIAGQRESIAPALYRAEIGPIPAGHLLAPTCPNRWCVNPEHQTVVTPSAHQAQAVQRALVRAATWQTQRTEAVARQCAAATPKSTKGSAS
jgi:hypothetical protein